MGAVVVRLLLVGLIAVHVSAMGAEGRKLNVLLLCVDDLRPELAAFGASYIKSPNIDRLAAEGRAFHQHYVQAPTCGASRYALLTGMYGPAGNEALFQWANRMQKNPHAVPPSMPEWFRKQGYVTVSVGKVSHHPGGRGGTDWNDEKQIEMPGAWDRHLMPAGPWRHPRGAMHGLAKGEIRGDRPRMAVYQAVEGEDAIYPDGLIVEASLRQVEELAKGEKPFFLAVGIIRPHLPFGAPAKYLEMYRDVKLPSIAHPEKPAGKTTWHNSGEFRQYDLFGQDPNTDAAMAEQVRRHYAACVSYADAQVGRILAKLAQIGADKNTIVILWGDHGWHLGEHAVWGKHTLFEESLRSPLIIKYPGMPRPGESARGIVEAVDLFPTICELADVERPGFVDGVSFRAIVENPEAKGDVAISYTGNARTIRTERYRMIVHNDGHVELYDHQGPEGETKNVAEVRAEVVKELSEALRTRWKVRRGR